MEGLIVLTVLFVVFAPIALAIVALVKVSTLRNELHRLRNYVLQNTASPAVPPEPEPDPEPAPAPSPPPVSNPPMVSRPAAAAPQKPKAGLEFMMGGKAAAFAGIAILVTGIVLLVGYAIQQSWIGPELRVVFGLLAGLVLVGLGHFISCRDEKFTLFARVLTGGGSALFYFTVFAAYAFYHLINGVVAGVGLCASALAVFGLSMVYCSQSVAVLGVLGAFITPLLIGGDIDGGNFPLVYVALINVPVILLGVRRQWQLLYNLAFIFTIIHYLVWLAWVADSELWIGLGFSVLFFLEYAALGLLKLRCEQKVRGRTDDMFRLVVASHLLIGAVYWLMSEAGLNGSIGTAFVVLALLHGVLALFAYRVLTRFATEILSFITGGLVAIALALPAQYDGEWVSLGWALEGVVLAWFACRVRSRVLQAGAFLLGTIGILKGLFFDVTLYDTTPGLFLNARFLVGAVSAALLGAQGWLAARFPEDETTAHWRDSIWWTSVLGILFVFFTDAFWVLGPSDIDCWLLTSLVLLATGATTVLCAPSRSSVTVLGSILLLAVPVKLLLIDTIIGLDITGYDPVPFGHSIIWVQLLIVGILILMLQPRLTASGADFIMPAAILARTLNVMSLVAGIAMVTLEIQRKPADWADMTVTLLWASCALSAILYGMKRRSATHRYFGLVLIGLASLKVICVDSAVLRGLVRIGAFIGTGILLLILAFAYQKASAYFHSLEEQE